MAELYCPRDESDVVTAEGKIDAMMKLRCRDCATKKGCEGPVFKEEKAPAPATPKRGRKPKAETGPEEAPAATQAPEPKPQETERETECRAALLALCERDTPLKRKRRTVEVVTQFQAEIAAARAAGVSWKPIAKTLKAHGFNLGWNTVQKAFGKLETKEAEA